METIRRQVAGRRPRELESYQHLTRELPAYRRIVDTSFLGDFDELVKRRVIRIDVTFIGGSTNKT